MIDFNQANNRFTYRAAAVILHNSHVLLTLSSSMDYWYLPGGRVELGETSLDALRREMREELDEEVQIERLVWIAESLVHTGGKAVHRIGLYFLVTLAPTSPIYQLRGPFRSPNEPEELTFQWHAISDLKALTLYPPFLVSSLQAVPEHPVHILDQRM
jgi:8-oxo-dGTP pyrophosphatase MutT (NUDIX family)